MVYFQYDAISTFNWLNADGRYVAAVLFPPKEVRLGYLEAMSTMFALGNPAERDEDFLGFGLKKNVPDYIDDFFSGTITEEEKKKQIEDGKLEKEIWEKLKKDDEKRLKLD